jgi:hypothetical protein
MNGATEVVDDVGDPAAALTIEPDGRQVMKPDAPDGGRLDGAGGLHGRIAEIGVDAHTPGLVAGHRIGDLVRRVAPCCAAHPG